jgi:hippurate hydrolase
MDEIVTLTAQAMGAKAELKFISGTPVLMNDAELAQCTLKYLQELLGTDMGINTAQADAVNDTCGGAKPMASEDFAYISAMVPTVALNLYAGRPDDGYKFPLHHCKVTFDETALPYGSAAYAYTAMRWLEEHR